VLVPDDCFRQFRGIVQWERTAGSMKIVGFGDGTVEFKFNEAAADYVNYSFMLLQRALNYQHLGTM
jgi:hypothetical protein